MASVRWSEAAERMYLPYDTRLGVTPQDETFTEHEVWNFAATAADQYPLLLHFPYFDLYRKQVVKQADLILAMHLRGEAFSVEQKARNFAYYEALTVRDSSLSASTQAVIAAEVGQLELAYDYLGEAALMDLNDLEHNVRDGVHIASLAGIRVEVKATEATYQLLAGDPLTVYHHGKAVPLTVDQPVTWPIPDIETGPRPTQPPGRAPLLRGAHARIGQSSTYR